MDRQLSVVPVALFDTALCLDVDRRQEFVIHDQRRQVRRVLPDLRDDLVGECGRLLLPAARDRVGDESDVD
jgi:hypothetical protein